MCVYVLGRHPNNHKALPPSSVQSQPFVKVYIESRRKQSEENAGRHAIVFSDADHILIQPYIYTTFMHVSTTELIDK